MKTQQKKQIISVVIPIYNVEDYLEKCLQSVCNQTFSNLEIICVNDGSTDNCLKICNKFAKKDSRIKIIDKKNTGYGNSMNIGMASATGDYIGIVESDDFIAEDMYEVLFSLSFDGTVDIVKGNFYDYYLSEDEHKPPSIIVNNERGKIPDSEKPFTLRDNAAISLGHPSVWSAIYRRKFLLEHKIVFLEEKGGGWVDNPFFYETLCKAKSIMWTQRPLYYYMKSRPTSSSNLQKDPTIPFIRMLQNIDVVEKSSHNTLPVKLCTYARALMYLNGVLKDFDYENNMLLISEYAQKLMSKLNSDIINKYFNFEDQLQYLTWLSPLHLFQAKASKILFYNWLPFDNPQHWGGGVTIYSYNLIEKILHINPEIQIYFLSSGFAYRSNSTTIFFQKIDNVFGDRVHQYEIVNSPVPASQRLLYVNPLVALENANLKTVFAEFLKTYGPFEVVHFNNIEGLSLDVLDLKQDFPKTKFIYSMHNYVPICLTGTYYMRHKHCICNPKRTDKDCWACSRADMGANFAQEIYERGKYNQKSEDCFSELRWIQNFGFQKLDQDVPLKKIQDFARTATAKINKNCDHILAVSKRVYEIAVANGLDQNKMSISYIGTKVASEQKGYSATQADQKNGLKIIFLGNDINYEEKGYPFLLDALAQMEDKYATQIDLVLTVKQTEHAEMKTMLKNFRSVKIIQGYKHEDLPDILAGVHLSIVPVLWEDRVSRH